MVQMMDGLAQPAPLEPEPGPDPAPAARERDAAADKAAQVALAMAMMTAPPVDEAEAEAAFAAMVEARAGETAMKLADGVFATPAPAALQTNGELQGAANL
jgi:hypothetical protein